MTLQKPLKLSEDSEEEDEDGLLLISESDISSWVVGMRVPYPYSHPRYDPNNIRSSRQANSFSPFPSNRLPTFNSNQESRVDEFRAKLSSYDYRYSAAFSEYEKCLLLPLTSNNQNEFNSCNLTQFIEIEKQKLANKQKFYDELALNGGNDPILPNQQQINQIEPPSIIILLLAGIFGGVFMLIFLFLLYILYLHSKGKNILQSNFNILQSNSPSSSISTSILSSSSSLSSSTSPSSILTLSTQLSLPQHKHHNLEIFHQHEIGRGSNGTVVFRGLFEGRRHVAVKKMVARFHHFERYLFIFLLIYLFL